MVQKKNHRRGHNEGTIFQRADGRWAGAVSIGWQKGKWKKKTIYGRTRAAVQKEISKLLHKQQNSIPIDNVRQTVETFLDSWLKEVVARNVKQRTLEGYSQVTRDHIIPHIGKIFLSKLTPHNLQKWLNTLQDDGIGARRISYARAVLRAALNQAMRWDLIIRNPATLVEPPTYKRPEIVPLTQKQADALCKAIAGDRLEALYLLALCLGLRKGEILGLKWYDVDLDNGSIKITGALQRVGGKLVLGETKTDKSRRTLPLPDALLNYIKAHRKRQLEEKIKAANCWVESGFVFTTLVGTPIDPRNLSRSWYAALKKAKIARCRFHDLRHSCATFLLAQGIAPRMVMEILGHSQISITLDTYTHVLPESKLEAVRSVEKFIGKK